MPLYVLILIKFEIYSRLLASLPKTVVNLFRLSVGSLSALLDLSLVYMRGGALDATLGTSNQRKSALQTHVSSTDEKIAVKVTRVDSLDRCF